MPSWEAKPSLPTSIMPAGNAMSSGRKDHRIPNSSADQSLCMRAHFLCPNQASLRDGKRKHVPLRWVNHTLIEQECSTASPTDIEGGKNPKSFP